MNKVSIITPCFNAAEYLNTTYQALSAQTYTNWEWVVVDDCSTDNSVQILEELQKSDARVIIIQNKQNSGAAITRNNSLNCATGEYLAFLDADDLWMTNKLQEQVAFIEAHNHNFVYHNYWTVDAKGQKIKEQICPPTVTAKSLLKFNPFATSSVMIKRDIIEKNNIRFKEHLRRRQDYLFWYDAITVAKEAQGMGSFLSHYRIFGSDSLSANKKKMAIIQWKLYREEFKLNIIMSSYYFICYAIHGIKKYFI